MLLKITLTCCALLAIAFPTKALAESPGASSRTDVTIGVGRYGVAVGDSDVALLSLELDLRYAHPTSHGVVARAWMAADLSYGFGGLDLGYLYRLRLHTSGENHVNLDLMLGGTIADADGCDEDSSTTECFGPSLVGTQSGGFVSPSISFDSGFFTARVTLNYRLLRDRQNKTDSRLLGLLVGVGFGK